MSSSGESLSTVHPPGSHSRRCSLRGVTLDRAASGESLSTVQPPGVTLGGAARRFGMAVPPPVHVCICPCCLVYRSVRSLLAAWLYHRSLSSYRFSVGGSLSDDVRLFTCSCSVPSLPTTSRVPVVYHLFPPLHVFL